jgi:hypothetical protein
VKAMPVMIEAFKEALDMLRVAQRTYFVSEEDRAE